MRVELTFVHKMHCLSVLIVIRVVLRHNISDNPVLSAHAAFLLIE